MVTWQKSLPRATVPVPRSIGSHGSTICRRSSLTRWRGSARFWPAAAPAAQPPRILLETEVGLGKNGLSPQRRRPPYHGARMRVSFLQRLFADPDGAPALVRRL